MAGRGCQPEGRAEARAQQASGHAGIFASAEGAPGSWRARDHEACSSSINAVCAASCYGTWRWHTFRGEFLRRSDSSSNSRFNFSALSASASASRRSCSSLSAAAFLADAAAAATAGGILLYCQAKSGLLLQLSARQRPSDTAGRSQSSEPTAPRQRMVGALPQRGRPVWPKGQENPLQSWEGRQSVKTEIADTQPLSD